MDLKHLDNLGLINFDYIGGFQFITTFKSEGVINAKLIAVYFDFIVAMTKDVKAKEAINLGKVVFTKIGEELSQISGAQPIPGFMEYIINKWTSEGWVQKT